MSTTWAYHDECGRISRVHPEGYHDTPGACHDECGGGILQVHTCCDKVEVKKTNQS